MARGAPAASFRPTRRCCSTWSCSTSGRGPRPTVDVTITALDDQGDGEARVGGRAVSVPFSIAGERVRVRLAAGVEARDRPRAQLIEVLQPSAHRVTPRCPHFGPDAEGGRACGGCAWQHIAYPEQLRLKTATVARVVGEAVPEAAQAVRPMLAAHADRPWGFRHKVHFAFASAGGRAQSLVMGHLGRGSRRVVPVRACPVHAEAGNVEAFAWRDALARAGVTAWDAAARGGASRGRASHGNAALRGIAVRVGHGTPERLTTLVVAHDRDKVLRDATRRHLGDAKAGERTERVGVHLNVHARDDGFIFGPDTRRLHGRDRLREDVAGVQFLISPTAFFQTNVAAADLLVRLVLEAIPQDMAVLDLYAGAGLFSLPLAQRGHRVTAVEENRQAVADGRASQALNRIPLDRCRWLATGVESAVRRIATDGAVVLDPPREGCRPGVLDAVFRGAGPERAIYVSCNPGTLGRDLRAIARHGYTVAVVQPVDMFPHTAHIETVVILTRRARDARHR